MKINKLKRIHLNNKFTIVVLLVLLILFGTYLYLWVYKGEVFDFSLRGVNGGSIDYNKPTTEQKAAGDKIKDDVVTGDKVNSTATDKPVPPSPKTSEYDKSSVGVVISAAEQSQSLIQIRAFVQIISSEGNCKLTITNTTSNKTFSKTANIQPQSTFSTCQGFDVDVANLGVGIWSITVAFENSSLAGSANKDVEVR